jgi:hypothetical protein
MLNQMVHVVAAVLYRVKLEYVCKLPLQSLIINVAFIFFELVPHLIESFRKNVIHCRI